MDYKALEKKYRELNDEELSEVLGGSSESPLYVIDGVPVEQGPLEINPSDIENISILKDAASVALYGMQAANGVILITTTQPQ